MSLILVVEPDSRHATQLAAIARNHLHAELVMVESGDRAVAALAQRVPDIVLTAPLLPQHDETVLSDYLRGLGEAAAHVQTLTIPILSGPRSTTRGGRGRFRRETADNGMTEGCDPAVFAEQVGQYLHCARQRRVAPEPPPAPPIRFDEPVLQQPVVVQEPIVVQEPVVVEPQPVFVPPPVIASEPLPAIAEVEADESEEANDVDLTPDLAMLAELEAVEAAHEPPPEPVALIPSRPIVVPEVIAVPVPTPASPAAQAAPPPVNIAVAVSVQVATQPVPAPPSQEAPRRNKKPKPVQDEWGFFDPDQCGFRALLARLDAIAANEPDE